MISNLKTKYNDGFISLLDLANEFLENKELGDKLPVPMYIIEESKIVPQMKPRFYSIVNDPFPNGAVTTQSLQFAFSLTKFES